MITDTKLTQQGHHRPIFNHKTQKLMDLVTNHGIDPKEAILLTEGEMPTPSRVSRLKEKARKLMVTAPKRVKSALQALDDTLAMKPITYEASKPVAGIGIVDYQETIMPSITNRLAAAAMILDRDQPIKNVNVNLNANAQISPVDLERYLG